MGNGCHQEGAQSGTVQVARDGVPVLPTLSCGRQLTTPLRLQHQPAERFQEIKKTVNAVGLFVFALVTASMLSATFGELAFYATLPGLGSQYNDDELNIGKNGSHVNVGDILAPK